MSEPIQTKRLRRECNKNPVAAYFLGGWNLVTEKNKKKAMDCLDSLGKKGDQCT